MLRTVAGVIVGYIAMAIVVVVGLIAVTAGLGPDRMLEPGVYAPSATYCGIAVAVSLVAAVAGGLVARALGGTRSAVLVLMLLVIALGGGMAAMAAAEPERQPEPRDANAPPDMAKMQSIRQPAWVSLANPVLGAVGLLLGGRAWRR